MKHKQLFGSDVGAYASGLLRLAGFFALIIVLTPVHVLCHIYKPADQFYMPYFFHRLLVRVLGLRLRVIGTMDTTRPVLFVCNHSSYLDIPVLGALIPAAFVAKAEVARWPLIGTLARLQNTVFIERRNMRVREHNDSLRERLLDGQNLILFPEGTSSDGLTVLPFKSSLFSTVENDLPSGPITVQPVSVVCSELDGLPITRALRPYYAWFGDMTLAGHLWNVFKFGRFTVDVVFHQPVKANTFANRKILADYCQKQVARGIEQCLTGRHLSQLQKQTLLTAPNSNLAKMKA